MTATNIDLEQFINVLTNVYATGVKMINMDMVQDSDNPSMNRLIIHPITSEQDSLPPPNGKRRFIVRNPNINTDNNDIFDAFNKMI